MNAAARSASSFAGLRQKVREGLATGLYYSGTLRALKTVEQTHVLYRSSGPTSFRLRRSTTSKFGILCYHRVGTAGVPFHSTLEPRLFEAQIRYLKRRYRIVPLDQLCREMLNQESVPPTLSITFDDGYRDLYDCALPTLRKYAVPATIYLIGRCVETGEAPWYDRIFAGFVAYPGDSLELHLDTVHRFCLRTKQSRLAAAWEVVCYLRSIQDVDRQRWCADFARQTRPPEEMLANRMLDWPQVRAMQQAGVFFGAHTMHHPAVSQLDASALRNELIDSKLLLEQRLGAPVDDFAYPFGKLTDGSGAAQDCLGKAGYRSAVTTIEGFNSPGEDPYKLRRLQIGDHCPLATFAFNVSRLFLEAAAENPLVWSPVLSSPDPILRESAPSIS